VMSRFNATHGAFLSDLCDLSLRSLRLRAFSRALPIRQVCPGCSESLLLTLGTVVAAAPCDDYPLDRSLAHEARFAFAAVDTML